MNNGCDEYDDDGVQLSPLAAALIDSRKINLSDVTPELIVEATVEIAAAHAANYLVRDGDELDRTMVRVLVHGVEGTDEALLRWLAAQPTPERLGIVARALWQLWSTANPHPPIRSQSVLSLIASATATCIGFTERGPYAAVLRMARAQVPELHVQTMVMDAQRLLDS